MSEDQLIALAFWSIIFSFATIFVLGLTNRVVIFYNGVDLFWSVSPLLWMLISVVMAYALVPEAARVPDETVNLLDHTASKTALWVGIALSMFGVFKTLHASIRHNGLLLGLLIGVFKTVCAIFVTLLLLGKIADFFSDDASVGQRLLSVVVFGAFLWVLNCLVNGERVMARRAQKAAV